VTADISPLRLAPDLRPRVWGGRRLAALVAGGDAGRPSLPTGAGSRSAPGEGSAGGPIGEAWVVWDGCVVVGGPWAGRTLAEVVAAEPLGLLGRDGVVQAGGRFPILAKIMDTTDWLSLQVHPDDATAARLEGPGHLGKTESWYVLDATPGAELILGVVPGATADDVRAAIRDAKLDELVGHVPVRAGDVVLVRAGLIHSIGPGILLYELQQSSDITYRVSDWGRPSSAGRSLHPAQSIESVLPSAAARPAQATVDGDAVVTAVACEKFVGDLVGIRRAPAEMDTEGRSFDAITTLAGDVVAEGDGWSEPLAAFASLVIPASTGRYVLRPVDGPARMMVARIPRATPRGSPRRAVMRRSEPKPP